MKTFHDRWIGTPPAGTERIAFQRMPGDAEAAAAIGGLHEQTVTPGAHYVDGRLVAVYAIGDAVTFQGTDGTPRMGRIVEAGAADLYVIASDDGHSRLVHADAIYPF